MIIIIPFLLEAGRQCHFYISVDAYKELKSICEDERPEKVASKIKGLCNSSKAPPGWPSVKWKPIDLGDGMKVYEFIDGHVRLFCMEYSLGKMGVREYIAITAFRKKSRKTPLSEKRRAKEIMKKILNKEFKLL